MGNWRFCLLFMVCILFGLESKGTHLLGGWFEYEKIASNRYKVDLYVWIDAHPDDPINLEASSFKAYAFSVLSNTTIASVTLNRSTSSYLNVQNPTCSTTSTRLKSVKYTGILDLLGVLDPLTNITLFSKETTLSHDIVNIINPDIQGITFVSEGLNLSINSQSPKWNSSTFPWASATNNPFSYTFNAKDSENDDLTYEISLPYSSVGNPPSFSYVNPKTGYNAAAPFGIQTIQINPSTRTLAYTLTTKGFYLVDVICTEKRNNIVIGKTHMVIPFLNHTRFDGVANPLQITATYNFQTLVQNQVVNFTSNAGCVSFVPRLLDDYDQVTFTNTMSLPKSLSAGDRWLCYTSTCNEPKPSTDPFPFIYKIKQNRCGIESEYSFPLKISWQTNIQTPTLSKPIIKATFDGKPLTEYDRIKITNVNKACFGFTVTNVTPFQPLQFFDTVISTNSSKDIFLRNFCISPNCRLDTSFVQKNFIAYYTQPGCGVSPSDTFSFSYSNRLPITSTLVPQMKLLDVDLKPLGETVYINDKDSLFCYKIKVWNLYPSKGAQFELQVNQNSNLTPSYLFAPSANPVSSADTAWFDVCLSPCPNEKEYVQNIQFKINPPANSCQTNVKLSVEKKVSFNYKKDKLHTFFYLYKGKTYMTGDTIPIDKSPFEYKIIRKLSKPLYKMYDSFYSNQFVFSRYFNKIQQTNNRTVLYDTIKIQNQFCFDNLNGTYQIWDSSFYYTLCPNFTKTAVIGTTYLKIGSPNIRDMYIEYIGPTVVKESSHVQMKVHVKDLKNNFNPIEINSSSDYRIQLSLNPFDCSLNECHALVDFTVPCVAETDSVPLFLNFEYSNGTSICGPLPFLSAKKKLLVIQNRKVLDPLDIANIFTPNGDGKNDHWLIPNLESSCNQTFHKTSVFDRWGIKVFETKDPYFSWEANGLPEGMYFYIIDMEPKQIKGLVQVQK